MSDKKMTGFVDALYAAKPKAAHVGAHKMPPAKKKKTMVPPKKVAKKKAFGR